MGQIASLNSLVGASPAKSRHCCRNFPSQVSQDSLSVQFSKSSAVERAPDEMGWEAKLAWPVEHVVGCCFVLSSPLWAPSESRVARSRNTGPAPRRRELQCGVPPSGAWSRHRPRAPGNWSPRSSSAERGGAWFPAPTPSRSGREHWSPGRVYSAELLPTFRCQPPPW